jgi:hypothetical protein
MIIVSNRTTCQPAFARSDAFCTSCVFQSPSIAINRIRFPDRSELSRHAHGAPLSRLCVHILCSCLALQCIHDLPPLPCSSSNLVVGNKRWGLPCQTLLRPPRMGALVCPFHAAVIKRCSRIAVNIARPFHETAPRSVNCSPSCQGRGSGSPVPCRSALRSDRPGPITAVTSALIFPNSVSYRYIRGTVSHF